MVLEDLHALIETLQERISKHDAALRKNEALTRYALIDPLLRELGWNTADPSQVVVEYKGAMGSADYALLGMDGKPTVIVEAKKLGMTLDQKVRQQAAFYCDEEGVRYTAITDGQHWEIYDLFIQKPLRDRLVANLDLGDPPAKTCLSALALWRPSVAEGDVQAAATPVVPPEPTETLAEVDLPQLDGVVDKTDGSGWHALSEFHPPAGSRPAAIRLPDETEVDTRGWGDFIAEIGRWLYEEDHLRESLLPIQRSRDSYVVADTPVNPTGKPFSASRKIGPFYANVNFASVALVRNAHTMIERTGQNPADFAVRLAK